MPLKLVAPIEKQFVLEVSDKKYGTDGEPTIVTIRQATQEQNEKRSAVWSEVTQVMAPSQDMEIKLRQRWTLEELKRMEVFLTLVGSNIMDENNQPLFRFRNEGGRQRLDMSDLEFARAWGKLPPDVAVEIHDKVLEINMTWAAPLGG